AILEAGIDEDTREAIKGDDVASTGGRAAHGVADGVPISLSGNEQSIAGVAQRDGAEGVRTDEVALDQIALTPVRLFVADDTQAIAGVARDHVPGVDGETADRRAKPDIDGHAEANVGHGGGARDISPDVIAKHLRIGGTGNPNATLRVAGNDVDDAIGRPTDRISIRE